jgi:branched-chain amino acid aminotransferase
MSTVERFPVWINGRVFAAGEGFVSSDDLGFTLGLGIYDGLLYEGSCALFVEKHLERLAAGAAELGITWPLPWDPAAGVRELCAVLGGHDALLRTVLTRGVAGTGPTLVIGARALRPVPPEGVRLVLASERRVPGRLETLKSTGRLRNVFALEAAQAIGAWEALFLNDEGDVSEGTLSNVFAVIDGQLVTPPTHRGCLPGIMRGLILDQCAASGRDVDLRRLEREELARASEVFLTNTSGRVIGVRSIDDVCADLPAFAGPVVTELRERIHALEEAYRVTSSARDA